MRRIFLVLLVNLLFASVGYAVDDRESYNPDNEPFQASPWPKPYDRYHLLDSSLSPDLVYGFICPGADDVAPAKLELVEIKPFRVLREMLDDGAVFHGQSSYGVDWAPDASAVLFIACLKWGVDRVLLVQLAKGKAGKVTDLAAEVRKLVQPSYVASKAAPFNDRIDFIFDDDDFIRNTQGTPIDETTDWKINEKNQVVVKCICTTDPKHESDPMWEVIFQGTWDITKGAFINHDLTVISKDRIAAL